MQNNIQLVCFDLNETLIEENTWKELNTYMGVPDEVDEMLLKMGREKIIDSAQAQRILLKYYQMSGKHSIENIMRIIGNYTYKPGVKETISYLRIQGYKVALFSGSMDILVEKIAHELFIDVWRANNLFMINTEGWLKDIVVVDNDEEYKLEQLVSICKINKLEPENCMCVGDGGNDIELFKYTGRGVTFAGSDCKQYAWKLINEISDIMTML